MVISIKITSILSISGKVFCSSLPLLASNITCISTQEYYKLINQGINAQLGGLNFAQCIIHSFNYADIKKNNDANDWDATFAMVVQACNGLKASGAAGIVFCANTMHLIADRVEQAIGLPIIHIAKATATEIAADGIQKVGLLGTKFTMELDFFTSKLADKGITTIIPNEADRTFIQDTIYYELGKGIINPATKERYLAIIASLISHGAQGIILGCTEIPLIIQPQDVAVPIYDTAIIHAKAAVAFSLV